MNLKNWTITKISTLKDRSVKIEIVTREMPPKDLAELFFSVNNEITSIDIPEDHWDTKSQSQRLRSVLYRVWESDPKKKEKYSTFTLFYNSMLEMMIENAKEKIIDN